MDFRAITYSNEDGSGTVSISYNERMDPWLQVLWDQQGSDLLLVSGSHPACRGSTEAFGPSRATRLTGPEIADLVQRMLIQIRRPSSKSIRMSTSR